MSVDYKSPGKVQGNKKRTVSDCKILVHLFNECSLSLIIGIIVENTITTYRQQYQGMEKKHHEVSETWNRPGKRGGFG